MLSLLPCHHQHRWGSSGGRAIRPVSALRIETSFSDHCEVMPTKFFISFKKANLDPKLVHTAEAPIASPFMNCNFFGFFGGFRFNMDDPTLFLAFLCIKTNFIILTHISYTPFRLCTFCARLIIIIHDMCSKSSTTEHKLCTKKCVTNCAHRRIDFVHIMCIINYRKTSERGVLMPKFSDRFKHCLLYTSDAADEL